jgi:hypothetical protein
MTTPSFRTFSYYKNVAPFAFPGLESFVAATPPRGVWPTAGGGAGRTGRSAEPLVHERYDLAWRAPLAGLERPSGVLVGGGRVVVNGAKSYGLWDAATGQPVGAVPRGLGASFIDVDGGRFLVGTSGGVDVYDLDGGRESTMMLSAPELSVTREILQGPGALVLVSSHAPPHGREGAVVESVRVRDYTATKNDTLYGVEPLGGITCEDQASVVAAAGAAGPVLAMPGRLDWRDWQLHPQSVTDLTADPIAISVDERDHAHVLLDDAGVPHLLVVPRGQAALFDLTLPAEAGPFKRPPLVAPSGQITLASPNAIVAVSPAGTVLWRQPRVLSAGPAVPATLSANGLVVLGGETLDAVMEDGRHLTLVRPPTAIVTPPVLANGWIFAATTEEVFALSPAVA